MPTIRTKTHAGADGSLTIRLPIEAANREIEVVVSFESEPFAVAAGWPEGFFKRTHGAWKGDLTRPEQGCADVRASLD